MTKADPADLDLDEMESKRLSAEANDDPLVYCGRAPLGCDFYRDAYDQLLREVTRLRIERDDLVRDIEELRQELTEATESLDSMRRS